VRRLCSVTTGVFLTSLLVGCSGLNNPIQTSPSLPTGATLRTSSLSGSGTLYVASTGVPGSVLVYKTPTLKLLRTITEDVRSPVDLELGSRDRLFVGNITQKYNAVNEYGRQGRNFLKTISNLRGPEQIAFDSFGNVYVRRYKVINIYPAGKRGMREIKVNSDFMALDSSNNLYVAARYQSAVYVYAPGSSTPGRTITDGIVEPQGLAFDASGNLYVAGFGGTTSGDCGTSPGTVQVYAPGVNSPSYTIFGAQGICEPFRLIFDATGNLYVANESFEGGPPSSITVYAPGSNTLLRTITDGVSSPWSMAFDQAGHLYVANRFINTVTMYSPGSSELVQTLSNIYAPESLVVGN
jgi:hypothetical protein